MQHNLGTRWKLRCDVLLEPSQDERSDTTAQPLRRAGLAVRVIEKAPFVGGLTRTVANDGFRFDLGGHRFYTKNEAVFDFVADLLDSQSRQVLRRVGREDTHGQYGFPVSGDPERYWQAVWHSCHSWAVLMKQFLGTPL